MPPHQSRCQGWAGELYLPWAPAQIQPATCNAQSARQSAIHGHSNIWQPCLGALKTLALDNPAKAPAMRAAAGELVCAVPAAAALSCEGGSHSIALFHCLNLQRRASKVSWVPCLCAAVQPLMGKLELELGSTSVHATAMQGIGAHNSSSLLSIRARQWRGTALCWGEPSLSPLSLQRPPDL